MRLSVQLTGWLGDSALTSDGWLILDCSECTIRLIILRNPSLSVICKAFISAY